MKEGCFKWWGRSMRTDERAAMFVDEDFVESQSDVDDLETRDCLIWRE